MQFVLRFIHCLKSISLLRKLMAFCTHCIHRFIHSSVQCSALQQLLIFASQRDSITLHYHSLRYGASPVCIHHSLPHTHSYRSVSEGNEMAHSQAQIRLYPKCKNWCSSKSTAQISREKWGKFLPYLSENIPQPSGNLEEEIRFRQIYAGRYHSGLL